MTGARLMLDKPAVGSWNMAVDEALLRSAADDHGLTLRVYRWEPATLSLGYFQSFEARHTHPFSQACPVVRRATGGGAIVHDQEITYSLSAAVSNRWSSRVSEWYDLIHNAWITTLAHYGIHAQRCPATDAERESQFLCFQRRAAGDLLLDGHKIGGSAQRRHRDAVLQHGSLLLSRSAAAPELPGIAQLAGKPLPEASWLDLWITELGNRLGVQWERTGLTGREAELARELQASKFAGSGWTLKR